MLRELRLSNFAVIEEAALEFGPGFNVLTGETGAGKSLLVGALNLILGERASGDLLRSGAEEASVEAAFEGGDAPEVGRALEAAGLPVEPTLIVRRVISRSGRNKIYLNGSLASLATLTEVAETLLGIFGQNEHHGLLRPEAQRDLLDAFAGNEGQRAAMGRAHATWEEARLALEALASDEDERARRIDYLRFLWEELEGASLQDGEEEDLEAERGRLANAERIAQAAASGTDVLYEGDGAVAGRVGALAAELARLEAFDRDLAEAARLLREAQPLIEEAARFLQQATGTVGEEAGQIESRLDRVEERLDRLARLKRKHGASDASKLLAKADELRAELDALEDYESQLAIRREALDTADAQARRAAEELRLSRQRAAHRLGRAVASELAELNMPGTQFTARTSPLDRLCSHGADRVEFLLSANPGEPPRPLQRVASGGELSRVLLALRLVLSEPGQVRTLVLDEVDAGIGGVTADVVGRKIAQLALDFQVLCITHLPQITCRAGRHLRVVKATHRGRTTTRVETLSREERIEELSRMLGGENPSPRVRETARELLAQGPR